MFLLSSCYYRWLRVLYKLDMILDLLFVPSLLIKSIKHPLRLLVPRLRIGFVNNMLIFIVIRYQVVVIGLVDEILNRVVLTSLLL